MEERGKEWVWQPRAYYEASPDQPYAVVLLNKGLDEDNVVAVTHSWQHACVRVCVDGATNTYHRLLRHRKPVPGQGGQTPPDAPVPEPDPTCPLPHIISGDFDSICPDLLEFYQAQGVSIVPTPDQDETDFTKALRVLGHHLKDREIAVNHILTLAGTNKDRFDHIMGIVATLYKVRDSSSPPVVVKSGSSLLWVLGAGQHTIHVPEELTHGPAAWCGLVPVGEPATATTTGLKWNLNNHSLKFGGLVSTSNSYDLTSQGKVTVTTSHPILWTMGWRTSPPDSSATDRAIQPPSASATGQPDQVIHGSTGMVHSSPQEHKLT